MVVIIYLIYNLIYNEGKKVGIPFYCTVSVEGVNVMDVLNCIYIF